MSSNERSRAADIVGLIQERHAPLAGAGFDHHLTTPAELDAVLRLLGGGRDA